MNTITRSPIHAVMRAEILFNLKRIAPYAIFLLFAGNAMLWRTGPSIINGWATNSDFYIIRLFITFSFFTLPFFISLLMSDPVVRDFRIGIDPLLFSKPISRGEYLLGKFGGNFLVLVGCQSAFAILAFLLQFWHTPQVIIQPARLLPYLQYFIFFTVISSLALATLCFTIATLTRNVKLSYIAVAVYYLLYITYQVKLLKNFAPRWRILLDPLLMNWGDMMAKNHHADWLNQFNFSYDFDLIINRAIIILFSTGCLIYLYYRFPASQLSQFQLRSLNSTTLTLNLPLPETSHPAIIFEQTISEQQRPAARERVNAAVEASLTIPDIAPQSEGFGRYWRQLFAAIVTEFRLLLSERSIVVLLPIAMLACTLPLLVFPVRAEGSYSGAYAGNTANWLLILITIIAVFYTGELIHRDRELNISSILWSYPIANSVLLLSKFFAVLLLTSALSVVMALLAMLVQLGKGNTPIEPGAYLLVYSVIVMPGLIVLSAISLALNTILRDKYLTYTIALAICGLLIYLFGQGYNHGLYNPLLYQLWSYSDLIDPGRAQEMILLHRVYWLAISLGALALAEIFFPRKVTGALFIKRQLDGDGGRRWSISERGWAVSILTIALLAAIISGRAIL